MRLRVPRWIWLALFVLASPYLAALGYILVSQNQRAVRPADAVIVLGSRAYYRGQPNPCLVNRVTHGAELVKSGAAPRMIVSGGKDVEDGAVEAEVMARIALGAGLRPDQVFLEPRSTSTQENLEFSRRIAAAEGWDSFVIVSEPFHLPRAGQIARAQGLEYGLSASRACAQRPLHYLASVLREPVALIYYALRGWN